MTSNQQNKSEELIDKIFSIKTSDDFNLVAVDVFRFQYNNNAVYRSFIDNLSFDVENIKLWEDIPCIPVEFFKHHKIISGESGEQRVFCSSGTTGDSRSQHFVADLGLYERSFLKCFEYFYGNINDYCIMAILPSYLEQGDSSLVYMVDALIKKTNNSDSGFYKYNSPDLPSIIKKNADKKKKNLIIGVSYALLDMAESIQLPADNLIIMETGGMKGRRKEMLREELHEVLCKSFSVKEIHSEYGMTELLSQSYSQANGIFNCPPWMKVRTYDINDPLSKGRIGGSGGLNIIDLANIYSCSFISTKDIGKEHNDGSFEVLGRFDDSDVRGCNLLHN